MDKTDFFNIMRLTMTDVKVVDADAIGIGLLVAHRNAGGGLDLQIGSNIPDAVFLEAFKEAFGEPRRKTKHG